MSEPTVMVASPPPRPPPPSHQKSLDVGVVSPIHKPLKERKETREDILIVDSRSKSKSKSRPLFDEVENNTGI